MVKFFLPLLHIIKGAPIPPQHTHTAIPFNSSLFNSLLPSPIHECRSNDCNYSKGMMESQDVSPPQVDASRPSLGFPLGTALLLIIIFTLSGVFSCCYHWDKFRSFRQSFSHSHPQSQIPSSPTKSKPNSTELKQNRGQGLPVLMPGDEVPKFIAMPCPCEPSRPHKDDSIIVTVEKPPQLPVIPLYL